MAYTGPTYVNVTPEVNGTGAISPNFSATGRQAGDMLLIAVETANETPGTPSGFALAPGSDNPQSQGTAAAAGGVRGTVFIKTSDGTETTATVGDSGNHQIAAGIVIRPSGGATALEVAVLAGGTVTSATTSGVFGGVTTTDNNCLIVTCVFSDFDTTGSQWSGIANAALGSVTERFDRATSQGVGGGVAIFTGTKEVAGATGNSTATGGNSTVYNWITLAIRNASGATTHDTSGTPVGQIGSVSGSAAHVAVHGTSGSLTGQIGSVAGSAAHIAVHGTSGALTGQIGSISGSATRFRAMAASGSLTGQLGSVNGSATRFRAFASSGALTGQIGSVAGSAARASGTVSHATSGVITGQIGTISGSAARFRAMAASGGLVGAGAVIAGSAARTRIHVTIGALSGAGSAIVGEAVLGGDFVNAGSRSFSNLYLGSRSQSEFYLGARTYSNG